VESAYRLEAWHDFFVMVGGAAGALTGLVFVAISLHLPQVARSAEHRNRSEATLAALLLLLVLASLALIPAQPATALGLELIVAFVVFLVLYGVRFRSRWPAGRAPTGVVLRTALGGAVSVSGIAAGVLLLVGLGWGVFFIVPVFVGGLALGIANSWSLLMASELKEPAS
jgi:hypothetical protein